MPTVLERLAALFSRDMRAVLRNPRAISMIENPSERVQMAAIQKGQKCYLLHRQACGKGTACRNQGSPA